MSGFPKSDEVAASLGWKPADQVVIPGQAQVVIPA
jgi:hypothetical protein